MGVTLEFQREHGSIKLVTDNGEILALQVVRVSRTGNTVNVYDKQIEIKGIQIEIPEKLAVTFTCASAENAEILCQASQSPRQIRKRRLTSQRLCASAKRAEAVRL